MEVLSSVKFRRVSGDKAMRRARYSVAAFSWISTIGAILSGVSNCGEYPANHRVYAENSHIHPPEELLFRLLAQSMVLVSRDRIRLCHGVLGNRHRLASSCAFQHFGTDGSI
jgi:hypothetical protein